ncbi:hypothetical protein GH714_021367 [Hevea brasiliensis]|uniref:Protein kinase domain-containing protein n=1 Tax=Hevea brasiliensis TaxID=3981 RepID=A0A6A6LTA1_HEVBR|nr:hypothetical protein GH714_021367 [Hevea brasiliensis]
MYIFMPANTIITELKLSRPFKMDWTRGRTIGRGSTSTVSIAALDQSGQAFAVKSAELSQSEFLQREQRILSALSCPQIIAYKGFDITKKMVSSYTIFSWNTHLVVLLWMQFASMEAGSMSPSSDHILDKFFWAFTTFILMGYYIVILSVTILVTSDGAKIADLGCAKQVDEVVATKTPIAGTPVYMAPEVVRGEHQGPADVWALGCTVVEMATGRAPWTNISDPISALYQIGFSGDVPEIPGFMSKQAKDFLSKCLKRDPTERWSTSELLEHDFITEEPSSVLKDTDVDTPTSVLEKGLWDSRKI